MSLPLLPNVRGSRRLAHVLNAIEDRLGTQPIREIRMRQGHMMRLDRRSRTERHAFYAGRYEDTAITSIQQMATPGSAIIDAGANIGFFTVPLALFARQNQITVLAFEPVPENFARLDDNLVLNGVSANVTVFRSGLSSRAGETEITYRDGDQEITGNAAIRIDDGQDIGLRSVSIPLTTLDHVYRGDFPPPSVLKVDIEGHEDEFLAGAQATLLSYRPCLFIEVNNDYYRRKGGSLQRAAAFLRDAGYSCLDNGKAAAEVSDIDAISTLENVWLVPAERRAQLEAVLARTLA